MSRNRILAIIQAGGAGGRMDVLTRERAKPALPFAGVYQLVDFPLSNLAHSGITEVWLSLQYQGVEPRGAGRQRAALEPRPQPGRAAAADAAAGHRRRRRGRVRARATPTSCSGSATRSGPPAPEVVLVLSADHVYRFDYTRRRRDAPRHGCRVHHRDHRGADSTRPATTPRWRPTTRVGSPGSPTSPTSRRPATVATEIFVYDAAGARRGPRAAAPRARRPTSDAGRQRARRLRRAPAAPAGRAGPDGRARAARLLARPRPAAPLPRRAPGRPAPTTRGSSTTRAGRSSPASRSGSRRASSTAPTWWTAWSRRAPGSPAWYAAACSARVWSSRPAPWSATACVFADTRRGARRGRGLGGRRRGLPRRGRRRWSAVPTRDAVDDPDQVTIVGRDSRVEPDLDAGARLEPGTT